MKKQENILDKAVLNLIILSAVPVILFPLLIAYGVYNTHIFPWIPGRNDVWMGFWASYSGTVVTLIVAVNSKSISDLQTRYYELNVGVNLRLVKVSIVPIIEPGNLNRYKIAFYFRNMAKSLIEEIKLYNIDSENSKSCIANTPDTPVLMLKVGEREGLIDITNQYFGLRDDNAILQFEINLKDFKVKKDFIDSYFYFSQFPVKRNDINLDVVIQVDISGEDSRKSNPDNRKKHLHIELFSEPAFDKIDPFFDTSDNNIYMDPFKIKIKRYIWKDIKGHGSRNIHKCFLV